MSGRKRTMQPLGNTPSEPKNRGGDESIQAAIKLAQTQVDG